MPTSSELCIQASRRSTSDSRARDLPSLLARVRSPLLALLAREDFLPPPAEVVHLMLSLCLLLLSLIN